MLQGDQDWWRLAEAIAAEDRAEVHRHNAGAAPHHRLHVADDPVPCIGAITTAPVVMLLSHPAVTDAWTPDDYLFRRAGWPLSALHPDAPIGLRDAWRVRLGALIDLFGAHHVSNSVAAVFLTPWCSVAATAERLRLPSRQRMLDLAATAAARDAVLVMLRNEQQWTEHAVIAALPSTRRFGASRWRVTELGPRTLGDDGWTILCKRISVHAWI